MTATSKKKAKKKAKKKVQKKTTAKKAKKTVSKKKVAKKTARDTPVKPKKKAAKKSKKAARSRKSASSDSLIHGVVPYKAARGEEYMGSSQADHFREILRGWRGELIREINRTIHTMQDETVNHPDPSDRATQETDISLELRSRDRERKLIRKIDETLVLIDSGDYGYCEKCGVEIGIARLEARPTANQCIDCKTLDEIREKQMN